VFSAFGDIFEDFFGFGNARRGQGGSSSRARRGRDIQIETQIEFLEACFGIEKEVDITSNVACSDCSGTGAKKGTTPTRCSYCNGYGQVQMSQGFFTISTTCPQCSGAGQTIKDKCETCRGQGTVAKSRKLKVKIPAGISDTMRLMMRGEGEAGLNGGPNGDLYVLVHVEEHADFKRDGDNIVSEIEVPFPHLALGATLAVQTIDGENELEIKAGTQSGEILKLKGAGIANLRSGKRGDHLFLVQAMTPTKLSDEQRDLLQKLALDFSLPTPSDKKEKTKKKKKGFFFEILEFFLKPAAC
jgi:molecular chaperone DnaJ